MTTALKAAKQIRPHVPLISFPKKRPQPGTKLTPLATSPSQTSVDSSSAPKIGMTPRGSGIPESELPAFLRRPGLSQEEIDAINMGGSY